MQRFVQFFVGCALLALVICAPVYDSEFDKRAYTTIDRKSISPDGNYYYEYYVQTGATQKVNGTLKEINGVQFYSVTGLYSYHLENGKKLTVKYIADENGFRILSHSVEEEHYYETPNVAVINPKALASLLAR